MPHVEINTERCAGCQECIIRCPTGALSLNSDEWVAQAEDALCVGCRQCVRTCPFSAIAVFGSPVVEERKTTSVSNHGIDMNTDEIRTGFFTWDEAINEANRCLLCPDPTCTRGCPAHNNIPGFIAAIREHDLDKATSILSKTSFMPDICSRVCDQSAQCEGACSWSLAGEKPVAIGLLERFITEQNGVAQPTVCDDGRGISVGVVGSGPAGVSAALELMAHGSTVTIYEKDYELLGVLDWGIPSFSLPDATTKRLSDAVSDAKIKVRFGTEIGKDITVDELLGIHDAVVLAHGASIPIRPKVAGLDLAGVEDATSFLKRAKEALRNKTRLQDIDENTAVLVIGAGNTAMDVARSVRRLGGKAIAVDWMDERFARVRRDELAEARSEGVEVRFSTSVEKIEGSSGSVSSALLRHTRQTRADKNPVITDQTTDVFHCKMVIMAMGYRVDASVASKFFNLPRPRPNLKQTIPDRRWTASGVLAVCNVGNIAYEREQGLLESRCEQTKRVWVAGDALVGPSTVVGAMAHGKAVADAIVASRPHRGN